MKFKALSMWVSFTMLTACKTAKVDTSELKYLNKKQYDPSRIVKFSVPDGIAEICVMPKHFPGADYTKGDLKDEKELCSYDFRSINYALCPKVSSTNPGLEVFNLPDGVEKVQFESNCRKSNPEIKKLAKYKMSVSCSYTGSILSYYHMSRILGIKSVPPAVIRTFDLEDHKKYAQKGIQHSNSVGNSYIAGNWRKLARLLDKEDEFLLTEDRSQSFGALSVNPRGEQRHQSINVGSYSSFMNKPHVKAVFNPQPIRDVLNDSFFASIGVKVGENWAFTKAVYGIKSAVDISNMILLDTIMGQQDRLGNIHTRNYYYYRNDDGSLSRKKSSNVSAPHLLSNIYTSVPVPRMILKDNDCGIRKGKSNIFRSFGTLAQIRHMSKDTYKRLMWAAKNWASVKKFLYLESTMATTNFWGEDTSVIRENLNYASTTLYDNCKSGKLILDLDVSEHLLGTNTPEKSRGFCDVSFDPSEGQIADNKISDEIVERESTESGNLTPVVPSESVVVAKTWKKRCVIDTFGAASLPIWKYKHPFRERVGRLANGERVYVTREDGGVFEIDGGYIHGGYTKNCVNE